MRILGDNVLISPLPAREKSEGGIFLPQGQAGDVMYYWKVEAIGPGLPDKNGRVLEPDFAVGQIVITPLHFSHTSLEDGSGRKIVKRHELIGKFEDDPPDI